jgi:hypothetical protein
MRRNLHPTISKPKRIRRRNSAKALLDLAKEAHALLKDEHLPSDLSTRHDYYLWEEEPDHT